MARITIYTNSVLASLLSLSAYGLAVIGVLVLFSGEIIGGILMFLLAVGMMFGADAISENKKFKTWKRKVEKSGLVPRIQSSAAAAIQVYRTYPTPKTLAYIQSLNPQAGAYLAQQLSRNAAAKKAGK